MQSQKTSPWQSAALLPWRRCQAGILLLLLTLPWQPREAQHKSTAVRSSRYWSKGSVGEEAGAWHPALAHLGFLRHVRNCTPALGIFPHCFSEAMVAVVSWRSWFPCPGLGRSCSEPTVELPELSVP